MLSGKPAGLNQSGLVNDGLVIDSTVIDGKVIDNTVIDDKSARVFGGGWISLNHPATVSALIGGHYGE